MEHRQFTAEHFRTFHPGGKLGALLSKVGDLMHSDMPLIGESAPMADALKPAVRTAKIARVEKIPARRSLVSTDAPAWLGATCYLRRSLSARQSSKAPRAHARAGFG